MKRPNGPRRDDRFRSNNRARDIRYYYAMHSELSMLRARRRSYILRDVIPAAPSGISPRQEAPVIEEEGAQMALFNIRGQLAIISHGDCNHPLVIRRIANGPRLSIRNPAIFYPIKKRAGLLTVVQNAALRLIRYCYPLPLLLPAIGRSFLKLRSPFVFSTQLPTGRYKHQSYIDATRVEYLILTL